MGESDKDTFDLNRLKIDRDSRRPSSSGWTWLLLVFCLIGLSFTAWFYWSKNRLELVEITEVQQTNSRQQESILNASGYVTPRQRATVASKVTGRVSELYIEEGMEVQRDQILARIDATDASRELDAAKAEAVVANASIDELRINREEAKRNLQRLQPLFDKGMISQQELDAAQTALDGLNARIELALKQAEAANTRVRIYEQNIDNYIIRAPFAGIIVSKDAQIGEMVSPISAGGGFTRTGIATIVDMDSLEIEVDINESYIARVTVGQKIEATLDAYPDWKLPSSVRTVIPTADRQKATVKVRIAFDRLDPKILPDMGIKVAFLEDREQEEGSERPRLTAKSSAILKDNDRSSVFVYNSGVIQLQEIQTGESKNDMIEILSGLNAGDRLIDNPSNRLKDGMKVKIQD